MDTKEKRPTKRRSVPPEKRQQPQSVAPNPAGEEKPKKTVRRSKKPKRSNAASIDVVYTQPGPFNRNRFLLRLITVVAIVLALVFGMSIFFKVKTVNVSGTEKYTPWEVMQASGIQEGENLLGISRAKISSLVEDNLPYIKQVRVGIQLPDTVNIEVVELDVVYSAQASDGSWWLIRADGVVVDRTNEADAAGCTVIYGVQLADPQIGEMAQAWNPPPEETTEDGQTVPVTVDNAQRLETALTIAQYLEENGMIGVANSIRVEELMNLEFWYKDRYQVQLGDSTRLAFKISSVKSAIDAMGQYQSGMLDASFTMEIEGRKDQVIYTPFS